MWTGVVKFSVEKIHITSLRWMLEWAGRGLGCGDCYPGADVDELEVEMLEGELVFSAWCGCEKYCCDFGD